MKITIEEPNEGEEDQLIVRCHILSEDVLKLIASLKTQEQILLGYEGDQIHRLDYQDIYYFESVDNKVFIYGKKSVFECKQKLYELETLLTKHRFFRATKSVILNLKKIKVISPAFSGRFEATLDNGEKVVISRQYVPDLKNKLGIKRGG